MADSYDTIRDLGRALNTVKTNGQAFQAATAAIAAGRATEAEAARLKPPLFGPNTPGEVIGNVRRAVQILQPSVDRLSKAQGAFALPVAAAEWPTLRKQIERVYIEGAPLIGYEGSSFNQAALLRDLGAAIASAPKQVLEFAGTTIKAAVTQAGGILKTAGSEAGGALGNITAGAVVGAAPLLILAGVIIFLVLRSPAATTIATKAATRGIL